MVRLDLRMLSHIKWMHSRQQGKIDQNFSIHGTDAEFVLLQNFKLAMQHVSYPTQAH